MLTTQQLETTRRSLQRIFALKVTKTAFREIQNAILTIVDGDTKEADVLLQALANGQVADDLVEAEGTELMHSLIDQYQVPIRLARDVFERGEFVSILTSDDLLTPRTPVFVNRIRRVDGEELQFVTDPQSTVNLLMHFSNRLKELLGRDENTRKLLPVLRDSLKKVEEVVAQTAELN